MNWRRAIRLVAEREIRERLRSRAFIISTLFLLGIVAASSLAGEVLNREQTYRVAVVAPAPRGLETALQRAAKPFDAKVRMQVVASAAAGRRALTAEHVDAVLLLSEDRLVFRTDVDAQLAAVADTAVRGVRRHLPPAPELMPATLEPSSGQSTDAEVAVALIGAMLMLVSIAVYGEWVLVGVVEEKSNRVVELILSTVQPRHLLAGKVIGIGLLGLGQLGLVVGLTSALIVFGAFDVPASLGETSRSSSPGSCWGSRSTRSPMQPPARSPPSSRTQAPPDNPSPSPSSPSTSSPTSPCSAAPNGVAAQILTVLPVSAPFVLPARSALVGVPLWEHALAVGLTLAAIYGLVRFAGRVYAHGLLHTGPRLDPRTAWRLSHHH